MFLKNFKIVMGDETSQSVKKTYTASGVSEAGAILKAYDMAGKEMGKDSAPYMKSCEFKGYADAQLAAPAKAA
jgi:hypothetical protein